MPYEAKKEIESFKAYDAELQRRLDEIRVCKFSNEEPTINKSTLHFVCRVLLNNAGCWPSCAIHLHSVISKFVNVAYNPFR